MESIKKQNRTIHNADLVDTQEPISKFNKYQRSGSRWSIYELLVYIPSVKQ